MRESKEEKVLMARISVRINELYDLRGALWELETLRPETESYDRKNAVRVVYGLIASYTYSIFDEQKKSLNLHDEIPDITNDEILKLSERSYGLYDSIKDEVKSIRHNIGFHQGSMKSIVHGQSKLAILEGDNFECLYRLIDSLKELADKIDDNYTDC